MWVSFTRSLIISTVLFSMGEEGLLRSAIEITSWQKQFGARETLELISTVCVDKKTQSLCLDYPQTIQSPSVYFSVVLVLGCQFVLMFQHIYMCFHYVFLGFFCLSVFSIMVWLIETALSFQVAIVTVEYMSWSASEKVGQIRALGGWPWTPSLNTTPTNPTPYSNFHSPLWKCHHYHLSLFSPVALFPGCAVFTVTGLCLSMVILL